VRRYGWEHPATALATKLATSYLSVNVSLRGVGYRNGKIMTVPIDHDPLAIVSTQSLGCALKLVSGAAAGSRSGIFGPRSITWRGQRAGATFLGAGRALLLPLAHPWTAAAVEQHSDTFANPIGRFPRTFSTVFTMVFGTLAQSPDAARRLHRRHASIQG